MVTDFALSTTQLANAKVDRRALYRGVMALVMHSAARLTSTSRSGLRRQKLRPGDRRTSRLPEELAQAPLRGEQRRCVERRPRPELRLGSIPKRTRSAIVPPSDYLGEMAASSSTAERDHIPPEPRSMRKTYCQSHAGDNYEAFNAVRAKDVSDEIARVTGKTVDQDENLPAGLSPIGRTRLTPKALQSDVVRSRRPVGCAVSAQPRHAAASGAGSRARV